MFTSRLKNLWRTKCSCPIHQLNCPPPYRETLVFPVTMRTLCARQRHSLRNYLHSTADQRRGAEAWQPLMADKRFWVTSEELREACSLLLARQQVTSLPPNSSLVHCPFLPSSLNAQSVFQGRTKRTGSGMKHNPFYEGGRG